MQDAPMNIGTPIFKIHKIQHFVTIGQKSLTEISSFHEQNHFITKAYDFKKQMYTEEQYSGLTLVAMDQNVKTYPTTQCKFLLILKMGVPVFIGAFWMQCTE